MENTKREFIIKELMAPDFIQIRGNEVDLEEYEEEAVEITEEAPLMAEPAEMDEPAQPDSPV